MNYHIEEKWMCSVDSQYTRKKSEKNMMFVFLGGLCDEFENERSEILNFGNFTIEAMAINANEPATHNYDKRSITNEQIS